MHNTAVPYLCSGTFLAQILWARKRLESATDDKKGKKESLSEQETFRRLISIYQLKDFVGGTSLKTYIGQFKSCTNLLESFALFSDSDVKRDFDNDIHKPDSLALKIMSDFVQEIIDEAKYIQLVRCLLDMIENDHTIAPDTPFYILGSTTPIKKSEVSKVNSFAIEPFLLGIWHFIIMNRSSSNENGQTTYQQWYPSRDRYKVTVGSDITRPIYAFSVCNQKPYLSNNSNLQIEEKSTNHESNIAIPLNNQYYSLIVTGDIEFENLQPITMPIDRVLTEYMGELKSEFLPMKMPTTDMQTKIKYSDLGTFDR